MGTGTGAGPSRGAAGTAWGPAATGAVSGGVLCPAAVTVTRGPRAAPPALQEKTLVVAKPDAVQRRLLGDIIRRFERRGFKLVAMKLLQVAGPGGERCCGAGSGAAGGHCPGVTVTIAASGGPAARGPALRAAAAEALLPRARRLHDLGAGGGHGEGTARGSRGSRGRGGSAVPVPQVWEGYNVVRCSRAMVGDSDAVGTIRGDLSVHITR